jgi:hypothetical protein
MARKKKSVGSVHETRRVPEVTYPDDVPAHTKVQRLYFDESFMLKRWLHC